MAHPDDKCIRHNHSIYLHGPCPACKDERWIRKSESNKDSVIRIHAAIVGSDPMMGPDFAAELAVAHAAALQRALGKRS